MVYSTDRSMAVVPVLVLLFVALDFFCFCFFSTRRFVLCLTLCYFVLVFFRPFSFATTSLGEERANLSAFRTFVRFVWFCWFPLPLGVLEGLRFVIVALPGLFPYLFYQRASLVIQNATSGDCFSFNCLPIKHKTCVRKAGFRFMQILHA